MFLTDNPNENPGDQPAVDQQIPAAPAEPDSVEDFNQRNGGRDSDQDPAQDDVSQDPTAWSVDTDTQAPSNGREG